MSVQQQDTARRPQSATVLVGHGRGASTVEVASRNGRKKGEAREFELKEKAMSEDIKVATPEEEAMSFRLSWQKAEAENARLRSALRKIHDREWAAGDIKAGARDASEMWAIADEAL
jgi:hypothetical protein